MLLGLVTHLLKGATVFVITYKVIGWVVVGVLILTICLSWVRKPWSAYVIACFIPLFPAAFLISLWLIVLRSAPVWEFILVGGSFMMLPITLSVQIFRDRATRDHFRFPSVF